MTLESADDLLVVVTELDPDPPDQATVQDRHREWQAEHVLAGEDRRVVAVAEETNHYCQEGRRPGEDRLDLGPGLGEHAGGGMAVTVVFVVLDLGPDQEHHQVDDEHRQYQRRATHRPPADRQQEAGKRRQALREHCRSGDMGQGLVVRLEGGCVDQNQQGRKPTEEQVPVHGHEVLAVGHPALGGGHGDAASRSGGGSGCGMSHESLQLAISGR